MNIFKKRINYKPFEYPQFMKYVDMMNQTFWVHNELDFSADVQDFHVSLNPSEQEVVKRSLLGIAQIEVAVKTFWGNLYNYFPKPEINGLGATFAECEFRHSEAYSRLLEVLGLNEEFEKVLENPVFKKRFDFIEAQLNTEDIMLKLLFFTIVIENASLFSQFANILSFTSFKGKMKNIANIISWTSTDEQIHAEAGIELINILMNEGYIDKASLVPLRLIVKEFVDFEIQFLDWIYEKGELEFFSKQEMINFMYQRVDSSLTKIGIEPIYNVKSEDLKAMAWYDEEVLSDQVDDFFAKRPVDYTKHDKSVTKDDLF